MDGGSFNAGHSANFVVGIHSCMRHFIGGREVGGSIKMKVDARSSLGARVSGSGSSLAPFHSITWSARASSIGGTSMPSAFAVFRLMTNSYLVGACTGRSAGFSPLRMRSTYPAARRYWSIRSGP